MKVQRHIYELACNSAVCRPPTSGGTGGSTKGGGLAPKGGMARLFTSRKGSAKVYAPISPAKQKPKTKDTPPPKPKAITPKSKDGALTITAKKGSRMHDLVTRYKKWEAKNQENSRKYHDSPIGRLGTLASGAPHH